VILDAQDFKLLQDSPVGTTVLIHKDTKDKGRGTHWDMGKIETDGINKVIIDYDHNRKDDPIPIKIENVYRITK